MLIKQNSLSVPRNSAHAAFGELLIVISTKKSALPPLFNEWSKNVCKNVSKDSNLDDSGTTLAAFLSRI